MNKAKEKYYEEQEKFVNKSLNFDDLHYSANNYIAELEEQHKEMLNFLLEMEKGCEDLDHLQKSWWYFAMNQKLTKIIEKVTNKTNEEVLKED